MEQVFYSLADKHRLVVLSGDNEGEKSYLSSVLPIHTEFVFNQKPSDKLNYIKKSQEMEIKF